jgi:hypothetical protein
MGDFGAAALTDFKRNKIFIKNLTALVKYVNLSKCLFVGKICVGKIVAGRCA